MTPHFIGADLLARGADGRLLSRIATIFPRGNAIVTVPGIHATQRLAYTDELNEQRSAAGGASLSEAQQEEIWLTGVDLVLIEDSILIRPDPCCMDLAFEADELLQTLYSKKQIRFLHVMDKQVRRAIQHRGELWRICPLPQSPAEMMAMIRSSRIAITGRPIYYYNGGCGTRLLTCGEFMALGELDECELRAHLAEICEYSPRTNRMCSPEISCFLAGGDWLASTLGPYDFAAIDRPKLKAIYDAACHQFLGQVPAEFQTDDAENPRWRSAMYAGQTDMAVSEETLLGLSAEFFMQVQWMPGGRIEEGELILDSVFEEEDSESCCPLTRPVCDNRARNLIFNIMREYADLESVNIGRIAAALSKRQAYSEQRGVYLVEIQQRDNEQRDSQQRETQQRGDDEPILHIIRMQKRGAWELLDRGKDLLCATMESEDYTESILDRRLACRQLGMRLPSHLWARKLCEWYAGTQESCHQRKIWSTYFERDYIPGLATDKIPKGRFSSDAFALALARLLGHAAASNLIVGRCDSKGGVIFDDGDELMRENVHGVPAQITVTDHTGTFDDCTTELDELIRAYAACVEKRAAYLPSTRAFAQVFAHAFEERFRQIQRDYRKRKRAFDTLFKHRYPHGEGAHRAGFYEVWECTLTRLNASDPVRIFGELRKRLNLT
jgi:hypothetical protein